MSIRTFSLLAGIGLMSIANLSGAQTTSASSGGALDEVIVTARRVEERLQDVPISIAVINREQLANNNVTNAGDLANFTTSLSANNNFGVENTSFAIRGFEQDPGTAPSVGTYFADVVALRGPTQGTQAGDGAGPGSFFDLQNVQVLMGPQGTLFGRNTTGGAVLLVPQKPTSKTEGYVELSDGNYDMRREQAAFNMPINDIIRFRIAVDHDKREGYLNNISGIGPRDYNDVDYTAVRASLVVDITSNLENYTIASYSRSETNGSVEKMIGCNPTGYNPPNPAALANFIGIFSCAQLANEAARGAGFYDVEAAATDPVSYIRQWQVINTTTWTASDNLKIKNIASYGEFFDVQRSPLFGTNWQLSTLPAVFQQDFFRGIPALFTGVFAAPGTGIADQSTYTEELQLQGNAFNNKLTYQGGAYFEWSDPLQPVGNQSNQLAPCGNLNVLSTCTDPIGSVFSAGSGFLYPVHVGAVNYTVGETTFRDKGYYAQSTYSFTDQFKLTTGVRETLDSETNSATRITNNFSVVPPFTPGATATCTDPLTAPSCSATYTKKSNKPTWLIDFDYLPTDDVLLYAKYARGYRAGGVLSNAPVDHRTFDPEKVDSYEVGFKTSFAQPIHGIFNAALFYNNFSNQQLQFGFDARILADGAPAPVSPTTAIINAGKSRIYGAEIQTSVTPFHGLVTELNYTYLNATIRSVAPVTTTDPNYQAATSLIAPGSPLVLSPKNKLTFSPTYSLPLPDRIGRVFVGGEFIHVDKQLTTYAYTEPSILALFGQDYGTLAARNLLNLNAGWDSIYGSPVTVTFFATNVTQEHYYQWVPGLATSGSEYATLGEPRMYGVRVRYQFGK